MNSDAAPYVYFLRPIGEVGPIKIGCSVMPESRLTQCMMFSPLPLEIAARVPGSRMTEMWLHRRLAAHRLHCEWFRPHADVLAVLNQARTGAIPGAPPALSTQEMYWATRGVVSLLNHLGVKRSDLQRTANLPTPISDPATSGAVEATISCLADRGLHWRELVNAGRAAFEGRRPQFRITTPPASQPPAEAA